VGHWDGRNVRPTAHWGGSNIFNIFKAAHGPAACDKHYYMYNKTASGGSGTEKGTEGEWGSHLHALQRVEAAFDARVKLEHRP
jgi:hypothetical protein